MAQLKLIGHLPDHDVWIMACPFCGIRYTVQGSSRDTDPHQEKPTVTCACGQTPHVPPYK